MQKLMNKECYTDIKNIIFKQNYDFKYDFHIVLLCDDKIFKIKHYSNLEDMNSDFIFIDKILAVPMGCDIYALEYLPAQSIIKKIGHAYKKKISFTQDFTQEFKKIDEIIYDEREYIVKK